MNPNNPQFIDSLLKTPEIHGVRVSPDLKWVAFTWLNREYAANVYIAATDGSELPMKLTDTDQVVYPRSWSADSKSLVVAHDSDGDERWQLFKVDIDKPCVMTRLTEEYPQYFIRGGALSPNGRYLVYGANYDFENEELLEESLVYRQDLETGERKVLARPLKHCYSVPSLNIKGTHILYERSDLGSSGKQIWLVDIDGKEDKEILNFGSNVTVHASWFLDGERVIFLTEEGGYWKVGVWHLSGGNIIWLLDDPMRNIDDAYVPYGSDSAVIIETKNAGDYPFLKRLDNGIEAYFDAPRTILPLAKIKEDIWLVSHFNSLQPTDLVLYDLSKKTIEKSLTDIWNILSYKLEELIEAENFIWKSVDDLEIQGFIYRAKEKAKGTIAIIHGGPTLHNEDIFDLWVQYFVARGFNVFQPNYRGSTGFSVEFEEAIKKDGWGGREQEDIIEGVRALIEAGIAEPNKIGFTGSSYGGYSSWFALTHYPTELIAASAPICGMTDLALDYYSTRPDLRNYTEEMMGGSPDKIPEKYFERSPINYVKNIRGKLLIIQGAHDSNVTLENVRAVEAELKKYSIPYELLVFEDEGHRINKPKNYITMIKRLTDFFEESFSHR